ncbi:hypothetical protein HY227_00720 [Candidatus Wolfebacteria bacterium]|nr:hypothetical protein [Candidatus Wolfebacteria bacterium]
MKRFLFFALIVTALFVTAGCGGTIAQMKAQTVLPPTCHEESGLDIFGFRILGFSSSHSGSPCPQQYYGRGYYSYPYSPYSQGYYPGGGIREYVLPRALNPDLYGPGKAFP